MKLRLEVRSPLKVSASPSRFRYRALTIGVTLLCLVTVGMTIDDASAQENSTAEATGLEGSDKSSRAAEAAVPEIRSTRDNWLLFRGDSFSTGVAPGELPDELNVLWRFEIPEGAIESTPVIANGIVYIADLDGEVYAIDLETGEQKWKYETETGFIASPAYQEASSATEGKTPESEGAPTARLFVGDYDGFLHCLDADSGALIWRFESGAEISGSVNFYKGNVLFGSQDATLYCLSAHDGKLIWKYSLEDQVRCSPTLVADRCFVAGCDRQLHILDVATGKAVASVPIEAPTGVTPAVQQEMVYFGTEAGEVFGIDWQAAKTVWTYRDARSSQPIRSCPAVKGDTVVIGSRSKKVFALDHLSGEQKWSFRTRGRVDSSPIIVGDRVFVGSSDGRLYALGLADGKKLWDYETGAGFIGSPAVARQRLVIANERGTVYCFGKG